MSYAKIIYNNGSSTETITDIWDVQIDPQSITGATYWQQESQTASFRCLHNTILDGPYFYGNANKPPVFRALVEIYETVQDGLGGTYDRLIFRGWMMQNSLVSTTEAVYTQSNITRKALVDTITIYDYIALLEMYLKDETLSITAQTDAGETNYIDIEAEYQRIWELVPASATSLSGLVPLWNRPNLGYGVTPYPDFGYQYDDEVIHEQQRLNGATPSYDSRIYEDNGQIYYEDFAAVVIYHVSGNIYGAHRWDKYRINGATKQRLTGFPVENTWTAIEGTPPFYTDFASAATLIIGTDYDAAAWALQKVLTFTSGTGDVTTYSCEAQTHGNYYLYLNGTVSPTVLTVTEDITIPAIDWLRYLLDIQIAWISPDNFGYSNSFTISNREIYPYPTPRILDAAKVYTYSESHESEIQGKDGGIDEVVDNDFYISSLNAFLLANTRHYNQISEFTCNTLLFLGEYVVLLGYNNHPMQITEVSYDLSEPQVYRYKGRSA